MSATEVQEEWAIRWPDGSISGTCYSSDGSDHAEQMTRMAAGGEEVVHRTVTITRTEWTHAPTDPAQPEQEGTQR